MLTNNNLKISRLYLNCNYRITPFDNRDFKTLRFRNLCRPTRFSLFNFRSNLSLCHYCFHINLRYLNTSH